MPKPGDRFGEFVLLRELGRGAMGVVWAAKQESLGREVALKVLGEAFAADPVWVKRFQAEAGAAARLSHPGILPVYAVGTDQGLPWFAMEKVEGRDLAQQQQDGPRPRWEELARWVREAALALQHAHENGVVHRDIKPANLMHRSDGRIVLTDFGLSKRLGSGSLTTTGLLMGTPYYMSPELVAGDATKVGPATDVYGLGVTLYELMTGRPPFLAENAMALIRRITEDEPEPPSRRDPHVPRDLETIALVCLEKRPEKRYASAKELAADLQRFLDREPISRRRPGLGERLLRLARRNRVAVAVAGVGLLALLGVTLFFRGEIKAQEQGYRDEIARLFAEADAAADAGDQEKADALEAEIERRAAADPVFARDKALETARDLREDLRAGRPLKAEYQRQIEGWALQEPAHVTADFDGADARVLGKRWVAGDTSTPVALPLDGTALAAGVWRLQVSAPGRLRTTVMLLATPGLTASLPVRLPPASDGNAGMLSYGGAWFPAVEDGKAARLEPVQAPYLLAAHRVSGSDYEAYLSALPKADRARLAPSAWGGNPPRPTDLDAPVVGLTRSQAEAYAASVGARLPTDSELTNAVGVGRVQAALRALRDGVAAAGDERVKSLREALRLVSTSLEQAEGIHDWDGRPEWALSSRAQDEVPERPWPLLGQLALAGPAADGTTARTPRAGHGPKRTRREVEEALEGKVYLRLARDLPAP